MQGAFERLGAHLDVVAGKNDVYLCIAQGRWDDKVAQMPKPQPWTAD